MEKRKQYTYEEFLETEVGEVYSKLEKIINVGEYTIDEALALAKFQKIIKLSSENIHIYSVDVITRLVEMSKTIDTYLRTKDVYPLELTFSELVTMEAKLEKLDSNLQALNARDDTPMLYINSMCVGLFIGTLVGSLLGPFLYNVALERVLEDQASKSIKKTISFLIKHTNIN